MSEIKKEKRVLFLINGLGMGNSTRCYSLIQQLLDQSFHVDIMTSNNGLLFFKHKEGKEIDRLVEIRSINYGKGKEGRLSIINTLKALFNFAKTYKHNNHLVENYLKTNYPRAIVVDSEYIFYPIRKRNIPIIALNNSDMVVLSFFKIFRKPFSIWPQFIFVEFFDFLFHVLIPKTVISPRLNEFLTLNSKFIAVGPMVRKEYVPSLNNSEIRHVVIMLSGSSFGSQVDLKDRKYPFHIDVIGREGKSREGLTFHGKLIDNHHLLGRADILVINAGFSAVSEAVYMRKPTVVIPIENHSEQYVNAKKVEMMGFGLSSKPENMLDTLEKVISNLELYRNNYTAAEMVENGSIEASKVINSYFKK